MLKAVLGILLIIVNLHADDHTHQVTDLLFFGAFGMIILYNLAHYLVSKDTAFASYFVFHLFIFVIMLFFTGMFDDALLEFSIHGVSVAWFFLAVSALLAFTRDFLELKKTLPSVLRYINALIMVNLGLVFLSVFSFSNIYLENLIVGFMILIAMGLLALSAYLSLKYRHLYARFYFFAFSFLLLAVVAVFLTQFGLLAELSDHAVLLFELGILFESGVFSFALAHQHEERLVKLKQNELLFKELSHRIQNNLQQIISILTLHRSSVADTTVKSHLQDTIDRIGSIALIHKTLQHSKEVGKIELNSYLESFFQGYRGIHPTVTFSYACEKELQLGMQTLTPLALILNELITNSLKHAFDKTAAPAIHCEIKNDRGIELRYTDNGSGFDPQSTVPSLGTKLITLLAKDQLGGSVETDTDRHYSFILSFSHR